MKESLEHLIDLASRTAIVTGAAKGIGFGIAARLHEAGANVVLGDLDGATVEQSAANLEGTRAGSTLGLETDVASATSVDQLVDQTVARFGRIDVLVNNAGIFPFIPLRQLEEEDFERVIDVNLRGVYRCTRRVAEHMIERGEGGRILNVTSVDAVHPSMIGLAHYDASKHGVWGFTKNVALELAPHRILVNAIAPGGILTPGVIAAGVGRESDAEKGDSTGVEESPGPDITDRIPMGRLGEPDEIGRVALFLASDLAAYMTGSQVVVDGGLLLS